jgi:hypothetical protein
MLPFAITAESVPPYVAPLWPAGHLPRKGGDHSRRRPSTCNERKGAGAMVERLISPLAGEMAGRPEGGAKDRDLSDKPT